VANYCPKWCLFVCKTTLIMVLLMAEAVYIYCIIMSFIVSWMVHLYRYYYCHEWCYINRINSPYFSIVLDLHNINAHYITMDPILNTPSFEIRIYGNQRWTNNYFFIQTGSLNFIEHVSLFQNSIVIRIVPKTGPGICKAGGYQIEFH
jgi:hypothetical protein